MNKILGAVVLLGFSSIVMADNIANDQQVATIETKECIMINGVMTSNCSNVKRIAKKRNAAPLKMSCEVVNGVNTNVCHPVEENSESAK